MLNQPNAIITKQVGATGMEAGRFVMVNANNKFVYATKDTNSVLGVLIASAKPDSTLLDSGVAQYASANFGRIAFHATAVAGTYSAGAPVYIDNGGKVSATKADTSVVCGYVLTPATLADEGEIYIVTK